MAGLSVGERLKKVNDSITLACRKSGRAPDSVHLLAVSKLQSLEKITAAFSSGQLDFAENYVQEATQKRKALEALPVRWHFIGRIQSNKLKNLAGQYHAIHSLDRLSLVEHLNRLCAAAGVAQNIFFAGQY